MSPDDPSAHDALRQALRSQLHRTPAGDSEALQARVLAQWQQRHAHLQPQMALAGGPGRLAMPRKAWGWAMLAAVLVGLALAYGWANRPDPAIEVLMQPDVLSQIGLGEL